MRKIIAKCLHPIGTFHHQKQQMPLYEPAAQLLNYAREIAVMTEEQFSNHFNGMSVHLKMTLRLNPFVNSKPTVCLFPWNPPLSANIPQQERSPPMANARLPQTLPLPETPQNQNENAVLGREYRPEPQNVVEQQAVNQNEGNAQVAVRNTGRRRARSRDSNESNDSYEPPRRNRGRNEVAPPVPVQQRIPQPLTEIDRVQQLLRTFGSKMKYQRYRGDNFPKFETEEYHQLQQEQDTDEEEFIAKLYLDIKENLALAFESQVRASFYHYVVGEKLIRMHERIGKVRFAQFLSTQLAMSKR